MSLLELEPLRLLVYLVGLCAFVGANAAYLVLAERKGAGRVQRRPGPNEAGWGGWMQPLADGLKLLAKQVMVPPGGDTLLYRAAPLMVMAPPLLCLATIPFGESIVARNLNIGLLFVFSFGSINVMALMLGGWASRNKYSIISAARVVSQSVAYEIPMLLVVITVLMVSGTLNLQEMILQQAGGFWHWNVFKVWVNPLMPVTFLIFFICMLAETNRAPFDMAEAESELVGGYHTEYSSMKFALFFLAEYAHMITGSAFFVVLFLGGWSVNPFGTFLFEMPVEGGILLILAQFSIVAFKIFLVICLTMALRWTLPRFRFDQLMRLAWEGMIPASLVLLLVTSFAVFMQGQNWGWMWAVSLVTAIFLVWITPLMPKSNVNKRIPMIGSRFNPLREEAVVTSPTDPMALEESGLGDAATGTVSMH